MGRCGCGSSGCGCNFASSSDVLISGSGDSSNPLSFDLVGLPLIVCTSGTRPPSPAVGQEIFETDTGRQYLWDGTLWLPNDPVDRLKTNSVVPPVLWTTTNGAFVNWDSVGGSPGGSPANQIAFTKLRAGTLLHCTVDASGFFHPSSVLGLVQLGFNVNGIGDYSTLTPKYPPDLNAHYAMREEVLIPGIPVGSHAITLRVAVAGGIGEFAVDGNDYSTMTVREVYAA